MFGRIAAFEFRYQLRHPVFWIAVVLFGLFGFGAVASDVIHIGYTANVHKNAPYVIASLHLWFAVLYMFVTTAFVANVVVRDEESGFAPIVRTTRIGKFDYLIGRLLGAYGASALSFAAFTVGTAVGSLMPWVDKDTLGPVTTEPFVFAYGFIALPVLFVTASILFALASLTRSLTWTYIGVIALFVLYSISRLVLAQQGLEHAAALWDPFGSAAFSAATHYWTPFERNALLPRIAGDLLWNRLLWLALALAILTAAYRAFRFETGAPRRKRAERRLLSRASRGPEPSTTPFELPAPRFDGRTALTQLTARTRLDMGQVFRSPAYGVLLALAVLLSLTNLWHATDANPYGGRIYPVTRVMIDALNQAYTFMAVIIAVFYAGELVWRERDRRTDEIVGATAVPDWAFLFPKMLALSLVLVSTLLGGVAVAVLIQAVKGYADFEFGKYLLWFVLPQSVDVILLAALALFVQALSPHKFVGWGLVVIYWVAAIVLPGLGLEHGLYLFGHTPQEGAFADQALSDMNGQGRFWIGAWWFRFYWAAFALILLVIANALWPRGADVSFRSRGRRLLRRLFGLSGVAISLLLVAFAATGVYIFLNTNVWNEYRTAKDDDRWAAEREKALWRFHDAPQPDIVDVRLDVDIRPRRPRVTTRGLYILENRTGAPLREVHVRYARDLRMVSLAIGGGRPKPAPGDFHYRIFALDTPMQPGERRTMAFTTVLEERGFRNNHDLLQVVRNGTYLNDADIAPALGMTRDDLLTDRSKRRKFGLSPEPPRPPRLGTPGADRFSVLGPDGAFVTADIRVSTDADQTPIAPGYKISDEVAGGRRVARFRTEAPILRLFSIQSARYAVRTAPYKGVQISVFYDPRRAWNVDRITRAMQRSLDYCQANFSPYQFRQLRVLEFPSFQGAHAQAFANTIPWSEGLGFISDNRDPTRIDMVTYVGAHEVAHQWWGHQVIGADEQGASMLTETLAQYSALMVMKHAYGPDMMRRFLRYELDSYLKARGGEVVEELPLARVEDQPYIHYRKGALVMYRLQDEIGEATVNTALRRLLADHAFKGAPYATTAEFLRDLRAVTPADKQGLITDLFERITLYDVKTASAVTRRQPDGRWRTTLTVSARKLYANGQGQERESPLNETLQVGLFSVEPGKKAYGSASVLALARAPIHSGVQTISLVTARPPAWGGVDPFNMLVDKTADDNGMRVTRR